MMTLSRRNAMFSSFVNFLADMLLVFHNFLRTAGNRWNSLLNRLCYRSDVNHFHQITQSEKII